MSFFLGDSGKMSDLTWWEYPFWLAGMNTPGLRFIGVFTVVNSVVLYSLPEFAFTKRGDFKAWKLYNPHAHESTVTWVPWWAPGVFCGLFAAIFI
jgi:hypothetical protein